LNCKHCRREDADFFVVDLKGDGRLEWLTSRLYLFTYLLHRLKGVRSVVFTATRGDIAGSYLGTAVAAGPARPGHARAVGGDHRYDRSGRDRIAGPGHPQGST
jgi:hypothetical protein